MLYMRGEQGQRRPARDRRSAQLGRHPSPASHANHRPRRRTDAGATQCAVGACVRRPGHTGALGSPRRRRRANHDSDRGRPGRTRPGSSRAASRKCSLSANRRHCRRRGTDASGAKPTGRCPGARSRRTSGTRTGASRRSRASSRAGGRVGPTAGNQAPRIRGALTATKVRGARPLRSRCASLTVPYGQRKLG